MYSRSLSCTCLCGRFSASCTRISSTYALREQDEKKYKERIFPGGEEEREKVCRELAKRLPGKDEKDLLMCYVHVRDRMTGAGLSFEQVKKETKGVQWLSFADEETFDGIWEVMGLVRADSSKNADKN